MMRFRFLISIFTFLQVLKLSASQQVKFWNDINLIAQFDTNLRITGDSEIILLDYSAAGHQLSIAENKLIAITPYNIQRQKNGYEVLLNWYKKPYKSPKMRRQYYTSDSLIPEKEIVLRKEKDPFAFVQDSVYSSFNEYTYNDSMNEINASRFFITWTYNTIRVIGSNEGKVVYLQFENGWLRAAGIVLAKGRKPDGVFFFYDEGLQQFSLNFVDGKIHGNQKYFFKKTEYNFSFKNGECIDCIESMKDIKVFESYFNEMEKVNFDVNQLPYHI